MATNENVNKVIYGNQTVMDITDTTAEESDVASGEVFYKANGARSVGTLNADSAVWGNISGTLSDQTDLQIELNRAYSKTASETSSLDDLDLIPVQKISASSDGRRNIKFRNLKSVLKTYFDNIYSTFSGSYNDLTNKPTVDQTYSATSSNAQSGKAVASAISGKADTSLLKSTVGWSGKNKLPLYLKDLKSRNLQGTWSGNVYSQNNITFTVATNNNDVVTGITINTSSASAETIFYLGTASFPIHLDAGTYIFTGCPEGGSNSTYRLRIGGVGSDTGSGFTFTQVQDGDRKPEIVVSNNATVSNAVFKPMLRDASISDDTYEPYHESVEEEIEQIYADNGVLGAKNFFNVNDVYSTSDNTNVTVEGSDIRIQNTVAGTYRFRSFWLKNLPKNTDVIITMNVAITSGNARALLVDREGSTPTIIWIQDALDGVFTKKFNTGTWGHLSLTLYCTTEVSDIGDVTYSDVMIRLASDPDDTYVPYAMTNRELTEEKLSISELKTIASSAADFAAFKTAIANL